MTNDDKKDSISPITLAITGAAGRMGGRLIALAHKDPAFRLVAAIVRADHAKLSRDAGESAGLGPIGVPMTGDLRPSPKVLIDFTSAEGMRHWLKVCRDRGIAMVIGTTGLSPADHASIDQAASDIAIVQAPNMSVGVNLLLRVAAEVAKKLGEDYDIEIVEAHHKLKKEAPSGTADAIADSILRATDRDKSALVFGRHGEDVMRKRGQIGMHSLRLGDEVGRHTVHFAAPGERIEITHAATSRDTFAAGALRAAKWIATQKPGRYKMSDVLSLS